MHIGDVEIKENIFLAPMAGITDLAFRVICKNFGCGLVYSEMISAKGLYYKNENTKNLMKTKEEEKPIAFQIFGRDPEIMAYAAALLESQGADIIDINMGCPTPKIVNNGDGCALMKEPELAGRIIEAVSRGVKIPVTVKIRKGWDDDNINALEMAKIAEDSGAKAIAIHGRTRQEFYRGKADWDIIKEIKSKINLPVIGNGDIFTPMDAKQMIEKTNCDGIMVGRGALGNPWIFKNIVDYLEKSELNPEPEIEEKINMIIEHINRIIDLKGEYVGIKEIRKHIAWYLKGLPNSNIIKNKVYKIEKGITIIETMEDYLYQNSLS